MGGDSPTIPETIRDTNARFENEKMDSRGQPGTGSQLFDVNMWAMQFARPKRRHHSVREAEKQRSAVRARGAAMRSAARDAR